MSRILAIAWGAALDLLRKRFLYLVLVLGISAIFLANLLTFFDESIQARLMKDLAMGLLSVMGVCMALVLGAEIIPSEIESRAILFILSKPVKRWQYIAGKALAVTCALGIAIMATGGVLGIFMLLTRGSGLWPILLESWFVFLKSSILATGVMALSTGLSRVVSVSLGLFLFCVAAFSEMFEYYSSKTGMAFVGVLTGWLCALLPDFAILTSGDAGIHGLTVPFSHVAAATVYAVGFMTAFAGLASLAFGRRDL